MRLDVVTIFPEYLEPLNVSLVGKARARGVLDVHVHDLREWTYDRHNTVDDTPYGGGPGMVMKTEPWGEALDEALADGYEAGAHSPVLVVPTPSGSTVQPGTGRRTLRRALARLHPGAVRGHRPPGDRRVRHPAAGRRGLHRGLCAGRMGKRPSW